MGKMSTLATLSLVTVAFVLGVTSGFYLSPIYQNSMYSKESMGLGKADRNVDLRYLNLMAEHHRAAILLAEQIETRTDKPEIRALAREIQENEPKLIQELYDWKNEWYNDTSQVTDPMVANLLSKDSKIDLRFLNALIAHHEEGIEMTKEIRTKSSRAEVLDNADAVENFLKTTLVTLKTWRKDWYQI